MHSSISFIPTLPHRLPTRQSTSISPHHSFIKSPKISFPPLHHTRLPTHASSQLHPKPPSSPSPPLTSLFDTLTSLFPIWVLLGSLIAYIRPSTFLWFTSSYILPTLALIMLAMGLTIPTQAFSSIFSNPRRVLLGAAAQYTIMPTLGYLLANLLHLPVPLAVGLILVAVCPGGAASNVVCFIAGADVALSVVLTLTSTLLSVLLIPLLMKILAGALVPISPIALFLSTAQVVILPLLAGIFIRSRFPRFVQNLSAILPLLSVIAVALINAAVVSANAHALASVGLRLVFAIASLHACGALCGYLIALFFRLSDSSARTLCIEVMMQNSSLAVSLATSHFANPLTAVPGAISATMHSIMGSVLAAVWRLVDRKKSAEMLASASDISE